MTNDRIKDAMFLYAVTDRTWAKEKTLLEQIEDALIGGATCIQLREKALDYKDFLDEALLVKELCRKYSVPFIINDNVDIAIEAGADGIHVGQSDMELLKVRQKTGGKMFIGVSAQTVEQALEAQKNGADYLGVGAVFPTSTKKDADAVKLETLKDICSAVEIPVVAIGGITKDNMKELKGSGIAGVALVSAIFAAKNIKAECQLLLKTAQEVSK
ncbi:MAG: thiamine phosphate synthase [Treponemataceae bacterium]|nr:thiamine phosphate synthase [Treponemataceae bacterium]